MKIVYLASFRESLSCGQEEVAPPSHVTTLAELASWLHQKSPRHAHAFQDMSLVCAAIDHQFQPLTAPLAGAREVAFFPPVTGG